jgi:hypothetical protein
MPLPPHTEPVFTGYMQKQTDPSYFTGFYVSVVLDDQGTPHLMSVPCVASPKDTFAVVPALQDVGRDALLDMMDSVEWRDGGWKDKSEPKETK